MSGQRAVLKRTGKENSPGPQEDRDVFRWELQKSVRRTKGVFCKRFEALKPLNLQPLSTGHGEAHCSRSLLQRGPCCSKDTVVACPKVESSILFPFNRYIGDTHPVRKTLSYLPCAAAISLLLELGRVYYSRTLTSGRRTAHPWLGSAPEGGLSASGRVCSGALGESWVALCSLVFPLPPNAALELQHTVCGPGSGKRGREGTGLQEVISVHS